MRALLTRVPVSTALAVMGGCDSPSLSPCSAAKGSWPRAPGGGGDDPPHVPSPAGVFVAETITEVPSRLATA
jgi:hypothetical protein